MKGPLSRAHWLALVCRIVFLISAAGMITGRVAQSRCGAACVDSPVVAVLAGLAMLSLGGILLGDAIDPREGRGWARIPGVRLFNALFALALFVLGVWLLAQAGK